MTDYKNIIPDYDLLARYFAGEATTAQIKAIEIWVAENAANKKSYDRMHFLWLQSAKSELEKKVNVTDAWTKMQFRMNAAKQTVEPATEIKNEKSIFKITTARLLRFAAIIIVALGVNFVLKLVSGPEYISTESQTSSVEITLPDNSEIKLNKESKISYPEEFKGKQRHIKLEGEAFFEVEPDKEKPFVIDAQFAQIKVVGTSFNVQAYDDEDIVEVTVVSGVVELSDKDGSGQPITLRKGEKGTIEKATGKTYKEINEEDDELQWMSTKIIFEDAELYQVAETLAIAYNVEIEFANEEVKHCQWNIVLDDLTIEQIIKILQGSFQNLTITQTENKITINGTCQ